LAHSIKSRKVFVFPAALLRGKLQPWHFN
jgi:hypothetical protein